MPSVWGIDITCSHPDAASLYDDAVNSVSEIYICQSHYPPFQCMWCLLGEVAREIESNHVTLQSSAQYLSLTGDPSGKCAAAVERDPGMVMSIALNGFLHLLSGGCTGEHPAVLQMRQRCQKLVEKNHCSHRERCFVAAFTSLAEGRAREATAILEAWLLEQPVDALAVRVLHDMYFHLGDSQQLRDSPGRVLGAFDVARPGYLKVCGMFAFGAVEMHQYGLAEEQGMRALSEDMRDPWALHAVAHVYEMQGRKYEGQRLLRTTRYWWDSANLMFTHLHWHWALFQLEDGQFEKTMQRYDMWIRDGHSNESLDLADAIALLWRMELAGQNVYDRWLEMQPLVRGHCGKHTTAFFDVHYAMCLAACGDDDGLDELMESMRRYALDSPLYSEAHSSSVPTPVDEDVPIVDPTWGWEPWMTETDDEARWKTFWSDKGLPEHATIDPVSPDATTGENFPSAADVNEPPSGGQANTGDPSAVKGYSLSEGETGSGDDAGDAGTRALVAADEKTAAQGGRTAGVPAMYGKVAAGQGGLSAEVRVDPPGAEGYDPASLVLPVDQDIMFKSREEEAVLRAEYEEAMDAPRPVLTCPMSVLPTLPLMATPPHVPPHSGSGSNAPGMLLPSGTSSSQSSSSSSSPSSSGKSSSESGEAGGSNSWADPRYETHQSGLVTVGGVGGIGLGSHSIIDNRYITAAVGLPLVEGMVAYRRGDYETAVEKLLPVRSMLHYIGGSNAQRDVFALTLEAAATQSRQVVLARSLLRERVTNRPNSGLALYHLSSVLYATGEHRQAGQARDRALRLGLGEDRAFVAKRWRIGGKPKELHRIDIEHEQTEAEISLEDKVRLQPAEDAKQAARLGAGTQSGEQKALGDGEAEEGIPAERQKSGRS